jgi:hypothetical protein
MRCFTVWKFLCFLLMQAPWSCKGIENKQQGSLQTLKSEAFGQKILGIINKLSPEG